MNFQSVACRLGNRSSFVKGGTLRCLPPCPRPGSLSWRCLREAEPEPRTGAVPPAWQVELKLGTVWCCGSTSRADAYAVDPASTDTFPAKDPHHGREPARTRKGFPDSGQRQRGVQPVPLTPAAEQSVASAARSPATSPVLAHRGPWPGRRTPGIRSHPR